MAKIRNRSPPMQGSASTPRFGSADQAVFSISNANTFEKQRIAEAVKQAAEVFLTLGVPRVEVACNDERERLIQELKRRPANTMLSDYGIPQTPVSQGLAELSSPFRLFRPQRIVVECEHDQWDESHSKTPMAAPKEPRVDRGIIYVFAKAIDAARLWSRYTDVISMSVAQLTYHEMLHVCGDAKCDGVIRHHHAGVVVVERLLKSGGWPGAVKWLLQ